jgi:hypothetical protein
MSRDWKPDAGAWPPVDEGAAGGGSSGAALAGDPTLQQKQQHASAATGRREPRRYGIGQAVGETVLGLWFPQCG